MNVLLSSVFGPYGVDDAYGRKENVMELFHNQVTREQGVFSLRFHHPSFGLYMIAENICAPTKVLDFPTQDRFVREIRKGYDYVGISFITPNFAKARRMAELVREHAPSSKIVLGGHGTAIPDIGDLIDCDHVCRGEGISWFRKILGEDPDRPLHHPAMLSGFDKSIFGVPLKTNAAVLVPGVGCPNGCRFCATSHFFGKQYIPFFDSGRELFDVCRSIEASTGCEEFFIMDENFLKRPERARELMSLMEEHGRHYRFSIFSSAETIDSLGVDFLARLGVYFLWIGVESKREVYEKNRGVDIKAMIRELRGRGISVLASGILFLEHHDPETVWEDIRFIVDLESDFVQFMQLGPLPVTGLYRDYEARGLLHKDVPYEEWHGQHRIWFDHPHFTPEESERILREAFRYDYDTQGSSILRICDTTLRGFSGIDPAAEPALAERKRVLEKYAREFRPALDVLKCHGHTPEVRAKADSLRSRYDRVFGTPSIKQAVFGRVARILASREQARVEAGKSMYQPRISERKYRMSVKDLVAERLKGKSFSNLLHLDIRWMRDAVLVNLGGTIDKVNARALARKVRTYMKSRDEDLVLVLDRLASIEDQALKKLLKRLQKHRDKLRIVFRDGAETVRAAVAGLPDDWTDWVLQTI